MTFKIGDRVRAEREAPARGSWSRYAGKTGWVQEVRRPGKDKTYIEIGVKFTKSRNKSQAWFLPEELKAW